MTLGMGSLTVMDAVNSDNATTTTQLGMNIESKADPYRIRLPICGAMISVHADRGIST